MSAPVLFHEREGWIKHNGGDRPKTVHADSLVLFQYEGGTQSQREQIAGGFIWRWRRPKWLHDIVAYYVTKGAGE